MNCFVFLLVVLAGLISSAAAKVQIYGQCGGAGYKGDVTCVSGTVCFVVNKYYSQCRNIPAIRASDTVSGYAALGGTTGGAGGPTVRVSTLDALKAAVAGNSPKTVILTSSLSGNESIKIGANKSVLGANGGITLHGVGLRILGVSNVIVRNLKISKVLASAGDAIGVQKSSRVWVDHVDLSSDMDHDKDFYDGLLDITHGSTFVTVSWSYLHDHWKVSLVGHSDDNGAEDKALTVTYHNNYFANANSRNPSFRFGTGHIYNNYYDNVGDGIDTRKGAQLLVENNVFVSTKKALFSTDNGYAVARGNDFGGAVNDAPAGTLTSVPYKYTLSSLDSVRSGVPSGAGANLSF